MRALGLWAGLHDWTYRSWESWVRRNGCWKPPWGGFKFTNNPVRANAILERIRKQIEPMVVKTRLRQVHPNNGLVIYPVLVDVPEQVEIARLTHDLAKLYAALRGQQENAKRRQSMLEERLRLRQSVELLKIPVISDMIDESLESGRTTLVFVNFQATLDALKEKYPDAGVIAGEVTSQRERTRVMDSVANDTMPLVLLNAAAGSESLNFQDMTGVRGRTNIVCPGDSAEKFAQLKGRTDRLGSPTVPIMKIVLAAGTEEESIYRKLLLKVGNIETLTNFDLELDLN